MTLINTKIDILICIRRVVIIFCLMFSVLHNNDAIYIKNGYTKKVLYVNIGR